MSLGNTRNIFLKNTAAFLLATGLLYPAAGHAVEGVPAPVTQEIPQGKADDFFKQAISLDLRDMDIIDVLKFLSLKGKFNLAISKSVAGRVTLVMKEVTIGDSLDIILRANNLAYNRVGNIVYIMSGEEFLNTYGKKFNDKTEVQIINLRYAKPSYVLATLDSLKSNVGKIVIDEDTGSVVLIDTKENLARMLDVLQKLDQKSVTVTYKLQYALAKDIAAQLKVKLDAKSVGSIQADDRSNQLVISALPDRLTEVTTLIKALDTPTKAVLIEVRILQIILNPKSDYGINWSNPFGQATQGFLKDANILQAFPISSTVSALGTLGSITYGKLDPDMLQAEISALKQVINSRVIARPRLMATNNEEANIHIGDTIPYVTSTTTGTGDTATVSEQINFIDVGIKLKVTPTINDDGFVTMKVRPEISSRTKDVETPKGALIPQINTTFVETNVIVKDGHTVIIGGLKQLQNKDTVSGLPKLMDIPLAGNLFKNTSKDLTDTEIVIFLTPHIVRAEHDAFTDKDSALSDKKDIHADQIYNPIHTNPNEPKNEVTAENGQ